MPVAGDIAKKARERVPITWEALAGSAAYGDTFLQGRVDSTKQELFGEVVSADDELDEYGPVGVDYAGLMVAIAVIPPGADYWASQSIAHSARQGNENKSFLDRASKLWDLHAHLLEESRRLYPQVKGLLKGALRGRQGGVMVAADPDPLLHVTPDPSAFGRPFELPPVVVR